MRPDGCVDSAARAFGLRRSGGATSFGMTQPLGVFCAPGSKPTRHQRVTDCGVT